MCDAEKYEAAMMLGWRVYRVPGQWIVKGRRLILRREVRKVLKRFLESPL